MDLCNLYSGIIVFSIVKKIERKKDINNKLLEIANASMI